jgi:hypothetical protein
VHTRRIHGNLYLLLFSIFSKNELPGAQEAFVQIDVLGYSIPLLTSEYAHRSGIIVRALYCLSKTILAAYLKKVLKPFTYHLIDANPRKLYACKKH